MGNPNASYYPFMVFIDGSENLMEGRYVGISYAAEAGQSGIYLQNAFLRTEQGRSYVFVEGEDKKLEKRYVTTGKRLWGESTEILSRYSGINPSIYRRLPPCAGAFFLTRRLCNEMDFPYNWAICVHIPRPFSVL